MCPVLLRVPTILPRSGPSPLRLLVLFIVAIVLLLLILLDDQFSFFLSGGKDRWAQSLDTIIIQKAKMEIKTEIAGIEII